MKRRIPARIQDAAPSAAMALVILAQAALIRLLFMADEARVFLLGRPLDLTCAFRARFGLPCPGCGMTRSIVLAVHGELWRAWRIAPGGAISVTVALAFAVGLAILSVLRLRGSPTTAAFRLYFLRYALLAAGVVIAVWSGGWATAFASALHHRY